MAAMAAIIDAHGHLGDILYPNGAELIGRLGVEKQDVFDPTSLSERRLHRDPLHLRKLTYRLFARPITRAERARNETASLENFSHSLDASGISHGVCLPIPPNVRFTDLAEARSKDSRIVPFTGIDYTHFENGSFHDPSAELAADVAAEVFIMKKPLSA